MKKCYYDVLGIEKNADAATIRKAYKKLTIKLHPDKNHDKPEAKDDFQELIEAYEVISNPNERAWYDSHREQILTGGEGQGNDMSEENSFGFDVNVYFSGDVFSGYGDNSSGFYGVYDKMFRDILVEEENARTFCDDKEEQFESFLNVRGFGNSSTPTEEVIEIYKYWENFITCKSFSWADVYKVEKDHDRHIKRLIDQENKRARKKAKRKYNEVLK